MKKPDNSTTKMAEDHLQLDPANWLENYGNQLYNYAFSRLGRHDQAEEVLQETLLAAVNAMKDFKGISSERSWLFGILKLRICEFIRNQWKAKSVVFLGDEADPSKGILSTEGFWIREPFPPAASAVELNELWQIVQACLRKLPSNHARVFVLRVLEEKKPEEICNELEISATNFRSRLYRARLGLVKCVSEKWPV